MQQYKDAGVTVSTVQVYPHGGVSPTLKEIAEELDGTSYGPIESNPDQLPQIFIKEATIVRRSLIEENEKGIPVQEAANGSDFVRGIDLSNLPPLYGLVLSSRKQSPQVEIPLVVESKPGELDPLLAHWQIGLGKSAVFTSDAHNVWATNWVGQAFYRKFWSQIVRGVSKPIESSDFDTQVSIDGTDGKVVVEALDANAAFRGSLGFRGSIVGPDGQPIDIRLTQTRPGVYEGKFKASEAGNYVVGLMYQTPDGKSGVLRSGTVLNSSPEMRDLQSNFAALQEIADRTGGRVLKAWEPQSAGFFTRDGLNPTASPRDIREILLPLILAMVLIDIAIRRIAWDWNATKRLATSAVGRVKSITATKKVETTGSIDALRDIRSRGATKPPPVPMQTQEKPTSTYKFEANESAKADLSQALGGATDKPVAPAKPSGPSKGEQGDRPSAGGMGSLLEAKRRAQQKIKDAEEGKK
ncbi:MAG: hypothetical protein QM770_11445 [Tepidisphaeraceae bacterium]